MSSVQPGGRRHLANRPRAPETNTAFTMERLPAAARAERRVVRRGPHEQARRRGLRRRQRRTALHIQRGHHGHSTSRHQADADHPQRTALQSGSIAARRSLAERADVRGAIRRASRSHRVVLQRSRQMRDDGGRAHLPALPQHRYAGVLPQRRAAHPELAAARGHIRRGQAERFPTRCRQRRRRSATGPGAPLSRCRAARSLPTDLRALRATQSLQITHSGTSPSSKDAT
jgi:hypothetical protein